MAKSILMDEFHVRVFAPRGLRQTEYRAIHRTLNRRGFQAELSRSVRSVFRKQISLPNVTVKVSR
jgi:hypothetical protein